MITFRLEGLPPNHPFGGTISIGSGSPNPVDFIVKTVERWRQHDHSLPTQVVVTGLPVEDPFVCELDELRSYVYLFEAGDV